jgi:ADP-ribosyl-[dinitrogen reductase] hydrolase
LGNDTDTVGACVGGLAGIYYGLENINKTWQSELLKYDYIVELCDKFNEVLNNEIEKK